MRQTSCTAEVLAAAEARLKLRCERLSFADSDRVERWRTLALAWRAMYEELLVCGEPKDFI